MKKTICLAIMAGLLAGCIKSECRRDGVVPFGDEYALVNNEHGSWRLLSEDRYDQCIGIDDSGWPVTWRWTCNTNEPGVKGYPQILFGTNPYSGVVTTPQLPRYVGDLSTLTVTHDADIRGGGIYNICFDLWFTKSEVPTPGSIVLELMVWLDNIGAPIAGEKIGALWANGQRWQIYLAEGPDKPSLLMFIATNHYAPGVTDIAPFLDWARDAKILFNDSFLACVEFGTEITRGSGVARVDRYGVEVPLPIIGQDTSFSVAPIRGSGVRP